MVAKVKQLMRILLYVHIGVGVALTLAVAFRTRLEIDAGQFSPYLQQLETLDLKWWIVVALALFWILPLSLIVVFRTAQRAGVEIIKVREAVHQLLAGRNIPITVDIDNRIPVALDRTSNLPVKMETRLDLNELVEIEANIPIETELPIDTNIETKVLGIGTVNIPIKARLPLNVVLPIKTKMQIKIDQIPTHLNERAEVELPTIDIPLCCQLETKIDLLSNIDVAREVLQR